MNCQDISRLLDDHEVDRLSDDEQNAARLHLAFCADCARDWDIHARLANTPIPSAPADLRTASRLLVAAAAGAGAGSGSAVRTRSRFILIGTLAAVAAAATMLGVSIHKSASRLQADASVPPVPAMSAASGFPGNTPAIQSVDGQRQVATPVAAAPAASDAKPVVVVIEPLQQKSANPETVAAAQAIFDALPGALRSVPNVTVIESKSGGEQTGLPVDYRLVIASMDVRTMDFSTIAWEVDGTMTSNGPVIAELWGVEIRAETAGNGKPASRLMLQGYHSGRCPAAFAKAVDLPGILSMVCREPVRSVALLIDHLRLRVFPADSSLREELWARFRNETLPDAQRMEAFQIARQLRISGNAEWQPDVRAVIDFANAANPVSRATVVRIAGLRHPDFLQTLIGFVRQDADDGVRLAAATVLLRDFADEPAARSALEDVARTDSRDLVRQVARRELSGEVAQQRSQMGPAFTTQQR